MINNKDMIIIIIISLVASIVFAFVDASFFLLAEQTVEDELQKSKFLDENTLQIATGALSASIAMFFGTLTSNLLRKKYDIVSNPVIDSVGILLGTILFICIYNMFIKSKLKRKKKYKLENGNQIEL